MSLVSDIVELLKTIEPQPFAILGGAADFAAIDNVPLARPAAYVLIKEEASEASERMTGPVLQRCEADVAIVIVADNLSDAQGAAAAGDIEALKATVRAAVVGFVPPASQDGTPVEHVSGQILRFRSGCVWHEEVFSAVHFIEEQS